MNRPQDLYWEVKLGGDAKAFLLALHRRNTGELSLDEIISQPTKLMPMIPKSPPMDTEKMVSIILAPQGVKLVDLQASTSELTEKAVERFCSLFGNYPDEIVLCPSRYSSLRLKHFYASGYPIPYVDDFLFPVDYDIIARGKSNG